MALPKLLQKLFQNGGAGDKLRPDVLPEIDVGVTEVNGESGTVTVKKLMLGDHVLELQEDGTLKLDESFVITSAGCTMTGGLTLAYDAPRLNLKNSNITKGVAPSSTQYTDIEFLNANGRRFATITSSMTSDGSGVFSFWHANASGAQSSALQVGVDANGNDVFKYGGKEVERVNSSGTNWIRYESGVQICWGYHDGSETSTKSFTVSFPVSFSDTNARMSIVRHSSASNTSVVDTPWIRRVDTTYFNLYYPSETGINWMAIGKWK